MSDDPFDDFDDDPDRQGDPFAEITDEHDASDSPVGDDAERAPADRRLDEQPFSTGEGGEWDQGSRSRSGPSQRGSDHGSLAEDDPFEDMAGGPAGDPFDDFEAGPGESFDEEIWSDLSEQASAQTVTEERGSRRYSEVSKHRFCEQCEHFTGPPRVACTHEGTEVLEFLDMETVRVVDCPVVAERDELDSGHQ